VVTVVSAALPAWRASKVRPVAAMRDADSANTSSPRRVLMGAAVANLGAGMIAAGVLVSGVASLAGVGPGVVLVVGAAIALGPHASVPLTRLAGAPLRSITGRLARTNAERAPRRTAATTSALLVGVAVTVVFAVVVQSLRSTVNTTVDALYSIDLVVETGSFGQSGFDASLVDDLGAVEGVRAAGGIKLGFAEINGSLSPVQGADPGRLVEFVRFLPVAGDLAGLRPDQLAVDSRTAASNGWEIGSAVPSKLVPEGQPHLTVGAIYDAGDFGYGLGVLLSTEGFSRSFPPQMQALNEVYLRLDDGADLREVTERVSTEVEPRYPTAKVSDVSQYKRSQNAILDSVLRLLGVMLVLAVGVALLGIVNTLLLSIHERRREISLLRAVGMTGAQLRASMRWEALLFSAQGTLLGMFTGLFAAAVLVRALGRSGARLAFAVPWPLIAAMGAAAVIAGVLAAVVPSRAASRAQVLDALRDR
jgi:putative ABC transport system permease protein